MSLMLHRIAHFLMFFAALMKVNLIKFQLVVMELAVKK